MAKLKSGVSVSSSGKISIGAGVQGVSAATRSAVATRNANIDSGNARANTVMGAAEAAAAEPVKKAPAIVPEAAKVAPPEQQVAETVEPVTPETTKNVIKTDALQARIDARNKAGLNAVTNPYTQKAEDVGVVQSEGVKAETAPVTPVVEPVVSTTAEETKTPVVEPVKTPEQLKQESDAAKANAEAQKLTQEQQLENIKTKEVDPANEDEAFAVLAAGGELKKSGKNAVFAERYRMYKSIAGLSPEIIADKNVKGEITQSQLDNLGKYDVNKFNKVVEFTENGLKIDGINKSSERLYNAATKNKIEKPMSALEKLDADLNKIIMSDPPSIRDLRKKYYDDNKEIKNIAVSIANKEGEIQEIEDAIEYQYDDMRGQFPNVPKGIMMGMVAAQTKELNRTLNTKLREKAILVAEHKAATDEANAMMQFEMQVVAEERANRTETINYMKEKYSYLKKDEDWEKEKAFQKEAATLAYQRGDEQAAKQFERQLQVLEKTQEFQKEESRLQRQQAWKIVEKQMEGSDWKLTTEGVDDDGRKFMVKTNSKTGEDKIVYYDEIDVPSSTGTSADGKTPAVTGTDAEGNDFWKLDVPNDTVIGDRWQCGQVVNDKNPSLNGKVGDSFASKQRLAEKGREPQAGDMFISNIGVKDPAKDNGHTGWITKVFANGDLEVQDSNFFQKNGKGVMNTRIVKKGDSFYNTITGFSPTKASGNGGNMDVVNEAINRGIGWAKSNAKGETFAQGLRSDFKKYGVGSQQVYDTLSSFAAANETGTSSLKISETIRNQKKLDDVFKLVDDYKKAGGNMNDLFGLSGDVNKSIERLKSSIKPGMAVSEATKTKINIEVGILELMQNYRRSMTGAAASILESKEYDRIFPDGKDGTKISLSMLEGYGQRVDQDIRNGLSAMYGASAVDALLPPKKKTFNTLLDNNFSVKSTNNLPDIFNSYMNGGINTPGLSS